MTNQTIASAALGDTVDNILPRAVFLGRVLCMGAENRKGYQTKQIVSRSDKGAFGECRHRFTQNGA